MAKPAFTVATDQGPVALVPSRKDWRRRRCWWRGVFAGAVGPWALTPRLAVLRVLAGAKKQG